MPCRSGAGRTRPIRSTELGAHLHERLHELSGLGVAAVRGRGLWAGVDIDPTAKTGRDVRIYALFMVIAAETDEAAMELAMSEPLRRQILAMKHYFARQGATVLLLDDLTTDTNDKTVHSVAHAVIRLEEGREDPDRRRLGFGRRHRRRSHRRPGR